MEWDEFELHSARRQVIKLTGHLLDARRGLFLSMEHVKVLGVHNNTCKAIEQNVDALVEGILETVKLCGIAADEFKQQMKQPNAIPPPISGTAGKFQLTPFQRALQREGVKFDTMPTHMTKIEARTPKILDFTLKVTKQKNRRFKKHDDERPL
jgi:hypothetical protein